MAERGPPLLVIGKVQGVYFRHSTRLEAKRLHIRGRGAQSADGSVEVLALGSPPAVAAMREWLKRGPAQAGSSESWRATRPLDRAKYRRISRYSRSARRFCQRCMTRAG